MWNRIALKYPLYYVAESLEIAGGNKVSFGEEADFSTQRDHLLFELLYQTGMRQAELRGLNARQAVLRQEQDKKKPEEITQEEKDDLKKCGEDIRAEQQKKDDILKGYAEKNDRVHQLIDLALLQNGLLKGEALTRFVKRSVEMIK